MMMMIYDNPERDRSFIHLIMIHDQGVQQRLFLGRGEKILETQSNLVRCSKSMCGVQAKAKNGVSICIQNALQGQNNRSQNDDLAN